MCFDTFLLHVLKSPEEIHDQTESGEKKLTKTSSQKNARNERGEKVLI